MHSGRAASLLRDRFSMHIPNYNVSQEDSLSNTLQFRCFQKEAIGNFSEQDDAGGSK